MMAVRAVQAPAWAKAGVTALLVAGMIIAAVAGLVERTTNRMLKADASFEAGTWIRYLDRNVPEFSSILEGRFPVGTSMTFLQQASQLGSVYQFALYNRTGKLVLDPADIGMTGAHSRTTMTFPSEAMRFILKGAPYVRISKLDDRQQPFHYAEAVIPVMKGGHLTGILQVFIDQNKRYELYFSNAVESAIIVGLLLAMGPILAFWYTVIQKRTMAQKLDFVSTHDPLTGLMNRATWLERFPDAFDRLNTEKPVLIVLAIDLSGVRAANETHGNAAGDYLLRVTGERLEKVVDKSGSISRLGSNQFGVVAAPYVDAIAAAKLVQSIISELSQPVKFNTGMLHADVCIGIAMAPADGTEQLELVKAAEVALASAMVAGRNTYRFFDAASQKIAEHQRRLERFAAEAIKLRALDVYFQPIVDLREGRLTGFEALIRVNHPELGPVSPADFIAAAESGGNIDQIGAWCIEQACRAAKQWPDTLTLSVNLSPLQFNSGRLVSMLRRTLEITKFPAYRLELEITEGIMMGEAEYIYTQLRTLQEMGIRVALDDFGTGYSSLSYLWKYPFSKIKIDQSFVRQLDDSNTAQGIVTTIVSLGRSIGVPLTAEGIETEAQLEFLRSINCDLGQGYLLSRPVPQTDLAAIILRDFTSFITPRHEVIELLPTKVRNVV